MARQKKKVQKNSGKSKEKIFIISTVVFIVAALTVLTVWYVIPRVTADAREREIKNIYSRINLGNDYIAQSVDIFGDKRPYDWDASRSYSSSIDYVRGANVDVTVADVQKHVQAAGFTLIGHPYPYQWQYKSKDNVYVRFNVLSKPRWEYFQNLSLMGKDTASAKYDDMNTGPSNITLKVNLDDNNE